MFYFFSSLPVKRERERDRNEVNSYIGYYLNEWCHVVHNELVVHEGHHKVIELDENEHTCRGHFQKREQREFESKLDGARKHISPKGRHHPQHKARHPLQYGVLKAERKVRIVRVDTFGILYERQQRKHVGVGVSRKIKNGLINENERLPILVNRKWI
jgi:hypothetical protein